MIQTRPFAESQLSYIVDSLHAIRSLGERLSLHPSLLLRLSTLSTDLISSSEKAPTSASEKELTIDDALELIPGARASLRLLSSRAHRQKDGQSPWVELEAALEQMEQEVGRRLRKELSQRVQGLYVIVDPEVTGGREPAAIGKAALMGGARVIQLRDKGESLALAGILKEMCLAHNAIFIVNDHADLAVAIEADGLHVGQKDLPIAQARRILKPHQLLGRSNNLVKEALESAAEGADHVAVGPIFPTTTKATGRPLAGLETLREVKDRVKVPVVAIGGINEENVEEVVQAGADALCVSSAVGLAANPQEATQGLVERIQRAREKV